MSRLHRWLIVVSAAWMMIGAAAVAWHEFFKPTVLTIAVGPTGSDDAMLVGAWSRALAEDKAPVRLMILPASGSVEALERTQEGGSATCSDSKRRLGL